MADEYDIIVLGAGSAGLNIAVFLNTLKLKVLMVEKHLVGGDCLNYGCVPSKALISMARTAGYARKAAQLGLEVSGTVDMKKIAETIAARQERIRVHENPGYLREKGIDVEIGNPKFVSGNTIRINGRECRARRIVIATGSRPTVPPIDGLDMVDYFTNETLFTNQILPEKLLVIGAGPIGIEMAQAYCRLGSRVSVLDLAPRILPREDPEVSELLKNTLETEGIRFHLGIRSLRFSSTNSLLAEPGVDPGGTPLTVDFDKVLLAAGRKPNLDGMELEQAGVQLNDGKLVLDKYLRTTNKKIFACGDVSGEYLFTHWAEYQAATIINNMLSPFKKTADPARIAWVTYTDPEVATFGSQPRQLTDNDVPYKTVHIPVKDVDRAICEGIDNGILKVHLHKGKLIGGTLMAKNAGELAGELISFMTLKLPFTKLYNRIYPYPTMARIHRKAVQKVMGEKLTPRNVKILYNLFKLFNPR